LATGDISFAAGGATQDISINSSVTVQSTGNLFLKPVNPATTIGLGNGAGTFNLTSSELGSISGFANVTIGSASQTGLMTVGTAAAFNDNVTLLGKDITISGALSAAATKNITLNSVGTITVGGSVSSSSGDVTLTAPNISFNLSSTPSISAKNIAISATQASTGYINTSNTGSFSITAVNAVKLQADGSIDMPYTVTASDPAGSVSLTNYTAGRTMYIGSPSITTTSTCYTSASTCLIIPSLPSTGSTKYKSFGSDTTISTGPIYLNADINRPPGSYLGLLGGNSITQESGVLTITNLGFKAGGAVTLTGLNMIDTVAGITTAGGISITNNQALAIGAITGTGYSVSGLTGTGAINILNTSGNLTISNTVSTTDATSSAITLNAGKNALVGTSAGGDIIISGSPTITTGTGGIAKLYTGSVAGSTGLTALVGSGSGRFRYYSDETATNYTAALTAGTNVIYREQPTVTITADTPAAITYGNATPALTTTLSGMLNGDTTAQVLSTAATVSVGGTKSTSLNYTAGTHTLTPSSAVGQLGYALSYASPSTLTVNTRALTGSITTGNTTYGSALVPGTASFSNAVAGDAVTPATVTINTTGLTSSSGKLKAGTHSGIESVISSLGGADASNYTFTGATGNYIVNPLALTTSGAVAQSKVYDGTAAATITGATLTGVISSDIVTLSGGGNFVDKNAGTTKAITGTFLIGGTDSANYTLTQPTGLTADITVRPLSTWTATTSGLWSNPANWDALPDGSNVLAVSIPSTGTYQVTYDTGTTTLQKLDSSQTLLMTNGSLSIGTALNTTGFQQSGGTLTGAGLLKVTNSFNQTGGSINMTGAATLTQSTGDMNIANLTASTATITSLTGKISQTGPIVTTSLTTQSATGTVLNSANQISDFSATNSTSGDIALTNTASPFTLGAITQSGTGAIIINNTGATTTGSAALTTSGGAVTLTAHSPLTIGSGGISTTAGAVTLTAGSAYSSVSGDLITINGPISSTGPIVLAGYNITGSNVPVGTNVTNSTTTAKAAADAQAAADAKAAAAANTTQTTAEVNAATQTATAQIVNALLIDITPVAPPGLVLVALAKPQEDSAAPTSSSTSSGSQSGDSKDSDSKDKDKDKDKNKETEQQGTSGDKKDAKPKKNYCN
jgi:hypothetical protein